MVKNSSLTDLLHMSVSTTAETDLSSLPSSQSDLRKLNRENLSVAVRDLQILHSVFKRSDEGDSHVLVRQPLTPSVQESLTGPPWLSFKENVASRLVGR